MTDGGVGGFAGISDAVAELVTASQGGGFSISGNGGQALLNAIKELETEVSNALKEGAFLGQVLPLGTTPNATVFKPFIATVADDPTQGAVPALRKLQTDLQNAYDAINKSIANTRQADEDAGSGISGAGQIA